MYRLITPTTSCVFGEMMIREALMPAASDAEQVARIWNYRGTPDEELEQRWQHLSQWEALKPQAESQPQMKNIIKKMLIER